MAINKNMRAWLKKNLKFIPPALAGTVSVIVMLVYPQTANAVGLLDLLGVSIGGISDVLGSLITPLLWAVLQVCGLVFMFAGILFELVISQTIVGMKGFVDGITAIDLAWRTIRDVANILFVFVLLLVSINIILGSWGSGPYNKSLIPKIIIAALLINFSLMLTKVVIDVSNIIAFEFYETAKNIREPSVEFTLGELTISTGITSSIADRLGVINFMGKSAPKDPANAFPAFSLLFGIITVLVATFVFLVMSALLLVRFILFIFLMITSPIAFIGELLPQLSGHSKKWRQTLSAQATFAPIFFVLILIVVLIINDPAFIAFGKSVGAGVPIPAGANEQDAFKSLAGLAFQYTVVIGLLIAALVAAKQTANIAGSAVAKWSGKAVLGGTAMLGRNTLGRLGNRVANSGITGYLASGESVFGKTGASLGKGLILGGDKLRTSSFDARGIKSVGADFGDVGVKGGLVGARKARKEKLEERGKTYTTAMAVSAQYGTIQEEEKRLRNAQGNLATGMKVGGTPQQIADRRKELEQKVKDAEKALDDARKKTPSVVAELRGETSPERDALAKETQNLTNAQRKEADTHLQVTAKLKDSIESLDRQMKYETDTTEKIKLQAERNRLDNNLNEYNTNIKDSSIRAYLQAQRDLSKIVKSASGQVSASQRAYGETLAGGSYLSTRQAGDALRKSKEKPEDTIAKEILNMVKSQGTATPATPATPTPGTNPPPPPQPGP